MTPRLFALAVALGLLSVAAASDVLTLTKDNFESTIAAEPLVLVKFFAPWCGHCKSMAEDFKSAATELKGKAVLADVDATVEEDLAKKYNIQGFPTLKVFADGKELTDYNGGRDKESMIKFIERATLPPFTSIEAAADYDKFVAQHTDKSILVGVKLSADQVASFKKATFALRDVMTDKIEFVHASAADAVSFDDAKDEAIYLRKVESDGSYKTVPFEGGADASIESFVKQAALPVFQELTQANAELYTEMSNPLVIGFYDDCDNDECKMLEKLALKNADIQNLAFAWVNKVTLASFMEYVGLKDATVKIFAYSFTEDSRFMLPEGFELTEDSLNAWIHDLKDGKVERARKSQAVPTSQESAVHQVVGDSWDTDVENAGKDVLIAQVAEWCGHCKALKPILKKVAEELANAGVEHVRIAMMDATENDAPPAYKAKGFPTVHFFKDGAKEGVEFDADRTSKGVIEWLQKHSSKEFEFDTDSLGEDPKPEEEDEEAGDDEEGDDEDDEEDDGEDDGEEEDMEEEDGEGMEAGYGDYDDEEGEVAEEGDDKEEL